MSDDQGPALSRRALRELRRAEAEAQLAQKPAADAVAGGGSGTQVAPEKSTTPAPVPPVAPAAAKPVAKPVVKSAPAKPAAAKPVVDKPVAAKPVVAKPAVAKPTAEKPPTDKPAVAKPAAKKPTEAVASKQAATVAPAAQSAATKPPASPEPKVAEATPAARNRRSAPGPVDSPPAPRTERSSLQRARDRENLRERRRLEGAVPAAETTNIPVVSPGDDPAPLTRRQLRLQALNAAKAAVPGAAMDSVDKSKSATPEASASAKASPAGTKAGARDASGARPDTGERAAIAAAEAMSVEEALDARRRLAVEKDTESVLLAPSEDFATVDLEVLAQQRELAARAAVISRRAAERQRLENENSARLEQKRSDPFTGALHQLRDPEAEKQLANTGVSGPETRGIRLDLTGQLPSTKTPAEPADVAPTVAGAAVPAAASKPAVQQAKSGASAPAKGTMPQAVKPAVAGKPAVQQAKPAVATPAPAKGTKQQAAKPVVTAKPAQTAKPPVAAKPAAGTESEPVRPVGAGKWARSRSAADAIESAEDIVPVRADDAQGLDPLDALTAGMRRANNMYLMVIAALAIGGIALITGIIMITTSR